MAPDNHLLAYITLLVTAILQSSLQVTVSEGGVPGVSDSCYCLQEVISNIGGPVSSVFYKDAVTGEELVVVVEQRGLATTYRLNGEKVRIFMDITDRVQMTDTPGESRGLLSLVLDPFYKETRKVYAYYIRNVQGKDYAYVSSFVTINDKVDTVSELTLLRVYQPYQHGNGGPMLFGDDGYLYVMTGDGGERDDNSGKAQNKGTFHGKVLRLDVDGGQSFTKGESGIGKLYSVPSSNPFIDTPGALEEVYAYGIRNMWGCSQDTARLEGTGRMFCAETGTSKSDEINIIERGKNYGWNIKEGSNCVHSSNCSIANERLPIHEFVHTSHHSLVGGHVYRGQEFPALRDSAVYTYADVVTGKTYLLHETAAGSWNSTEWGPCGQDKCPGGVQHAPLKHVFSIGRDLSGELYLLMTKGFVPTQTTGKMFKLLPPRSSSARVTSTVLSSILSLVVIFRCTYN